jgi:hypothetical protein
MGLWSADVVADSQRLSAMGWQIVITDGPDGTPRNFAYHDPGQGGLYVELLASSLQSIMTPWMEGTAPAPGGGP